MGANAQTSVPTFTAGDVLTAANMNISARTGVPVFADTTARDAAFGGTGEKVLAEGQMAYVENLTGDAQIQYYDGSTWNSLGAGGLTLITAQTIGNAVSSVTVSNAFSATYENYRIIVSGGAGSATADLRLTLGAANTAYYYAGTDVRFATGVVAGANGSNAAYWLGGITTTSGTNTVIDILRPQAADETIYFANYSRMTTDGFNFQVGGYLNNTTAYTDFTFTTSTGTLTGGTIRVYGYRN